MTAADWGIPTPSQGMPITPFAVPFQAQGDAIATALDTIKGLAFPRYSTRALLPTTGVQKYQHATVTADALDANNGDWYYDGSTWQRYLDDTGWLTPTLQGGNTPSVQYRRKNGIVYLTGSWVPTADDQVLFTLPTGFRILKQTIFWCERGVLTGPAAKVDIRPNGQVYYRNSSGGTGAINFGGVSPFPADG